MSLRVLPISNPSDEHSLDNVLSEEVLTKFVSASSDYSSYVLDIDLASTSKTFKGVVNGYYIEGDITTLLSGVQATVSNTPLYLQLSVPNGMTNASPALSTTPSDDDNIKELQIAVYDGRTWKPTSYRRVKPRALDLSQTLVLRCGTASDVVNLS